MKIHRLLARSVTAIRRRIAPRSLPPRERLLATMPQGGVCAEIGVWRGDFSARILAVARPTKLYLIDPWTSREEPEYSKAWYGPSAGEVGMDEVFAGVARRFGRQIAAGRIELVRSTSADAAARFEAGSFDWIYIDGDHLYEGVKADLHSYYPKVKPGGVVAGDDYGVEGWWEDGVTRAVDEFARDSPDELTIVGTQFVLRKPR